jgi:hypothetical protein
MAVRRDRRGRRLEPAILHAFEKIARRRYQQWCANRADGSLRQDLRALMAKYFSAGMETLHYGSGQ